MGHRPLGVKALRGWERVAGRERGEILDGFVFPTLSTKNVGLYSPRHSSKKLLFEAWCVQHQFHKKTYMFFLMFRAKVEPHGGQITICSESFRSRPAAMSCYAESVFLQIQSRKHMRDHADYTNPTQKHVLYWYRSGIYLP